MIKVLCIGNSFSQDATAKLEFLGSELSVRNLYIGGCSLERHAKNITDSEDTYAYERMGLCLKKITLMDALKADKWDIITVQQVSYLAGVEESYYPYLTDLLNAIKETNPEATVLFHQTWAYEIDSTHKYFADYECNQTIMYNKIVETTEKIAEKEGLDIIPSGRFIQQLRSLPRFDYANGGKSLCRDGFHMDLGYGRYALSLLWYFLFTGEISKVVPEGVADEDAAEIRAALAELAEM